MQQYLNKNLNVIDGVLATAWKIKNRREGELHTTGIVIWCGPQGSGKTLSMIHVLKDILKDYPKAKIVTNIAFNFEVENEVIEYQGFESFQIDNGIYGVIYVLDEIHLILNSLESKGVPLSVIVELSQQRKQRKLILGTSQVYSRMAKPLREQIKNVIVCKNFFNIFQLNYLIDAFNTKEKDGELKVDKVKTSFFFHSKEDYLAYDTFKKMSLYVGINNNVSSYT